MTSDPTRVEPSSLDRTLGAVRDEHRRAVLRSLANHHGRTLDRDALVEEVAEQVTDEGSLSSDDRKRIAIKLHHVHLPKLAECGMIEYDTETLRIRETLDESENNLLVLLDSYPAPVASST